MAYFTILLAPLGVCVCAFAFGRHRVTLREFLLHLGVTLGVAGASVAICYYGSTADVEVWNGRVTKKDQVRVSCSHSYDCNCRTVYSGSGKNRTSRRVCETCYEHTNDYDWRVYTTVGSLNIARVDRQGRHEPPRWTQVQIGEPAARENTYENYIKGAPDSLFVNKVEALAGPRPNHPRVHDYYRIHRMVPVGAVVTNRHVWEAALNELNADLGARKQANIIIVPTTQSYEWYNTLRHHWLGGKKNDIVVVLGIANKQVSWARVMAWSKSDIFQVKLRDALLEQTFTPETVLPLVRKHVSANFQRKPMADFEYLKSSIQPTTSQLVWSILINLLLSIGIAAYVTLNQEQDYGTRIQTGNWGRSLRRRLHDWRV